MTRLMKKDEHESIVFAIKLMLSHFDPPSRMAVLGDLVALVLAGHQGSDAPAIREEGLEMFIKLVRDLIPINEKIVMQVAETKGSA